MIEYEKSYKSLIESFKEWLIENCQYEDELDYYKTASDQNIIGCVFDTMDFAVKQPNLQLQAMQFEIMRKAFSR